MANYSELPIYRSCYDLLQLLTIYVKNFPKNFKYNLASKLLDETVNMVVFVYKANVCKDSRVEHLELVIEKIMVLELMLRLCKDMQFITVVQFSETVTLTDSIIRQAQGWLNHSKK